MVDDARAPAGFMAGATKPPKAREKQEEPGASAKARKARILSASADCKRRRLR
jgi:hypothetical protein